MTAVLVGYACYMWRARLTTRVQFDKTRLLAMLRPGRTRWAALNILVYWVLIGALVAEVGTGVLLFAGAGRLTLAIHLYATFMSIACVVAHVALHAAYGGMAQLSRIVRPGPLHVARPPPDLAELLAEQLAERAERNARDAPSAGAETGDQHRRNQKPVSLSAHPLALAVGAMVTVCSLAVGAEHVSRPALRVVEITEAETPKLDGDLSDPAWTKAAPVFVQTTQGGDFGGTRQSLIEIRALHDGQYAYFAFVWEDPTRSLKHLPLVKRSGRWQIAASRADLGDETKYHEDKLAVLLARPGLPLIGAAIHLARQPLSSLPPSSSGRGLHYTVDGSIADVWQWRASHGGPAGHIDNCHIGGPLAPGDAAPVAKSHYSGGFARDPGVVPYQSNFEDAAGPDGATALRPLRLPRDPAAIAAAMGRISDAATESESEGSRWWMTLGESVPYAAALDAKIADGTVIPGVLVVQEIADTRIGIRGAARWAAGRWTLELVRRIHTGSAYDIPIKTGVLMWVAAFDHAEKRHTRHLRPFRLEVD